MTGIYFGIPCLKFWEPNYSFSDARLKTDVVISKNQQQPKIIFDGFIL